MNEKEKLELIKRNTEEILTEQALSDLLKKNKTPSVYCGYEISGPIHLGHFVTITKLLDLQKAGFKLKILLADIHTILNKKKPEIEKWENSLKAIGIKAQFILGSSFQFNKDYQFDVMSLAQASTITRGIRSMQLLTRNIENATISQIWYPLMQIADIKHLKVQVALGGMDQRKIHTLGKDLSKELNYDFIAIHTPLITSLKGPGQKMSSSIPGSNISITDSKETIKKTISKAYCPEKKSEDNPILQITELILFPHQNKLKISRPVKFGGDIVYMSYQDLESDYSSGKLHPADLKSAVADSLEKLIAPIRKNF
jgi:tyrosyl-tRNA synthetase